MALGVERAVVVIFVSFAVDVICARLGLHQHDRPVAAAEFGGEVIRDDLELFDRGQRRALPILVFR
jgi:hypothetical protein